MKPSGLRAVTVWTNHKACIHNSNSLYAIAILFIHSFSFSCKLTKIHFEEGMILSVEDETILAADSYKYMILYKNGQILINHAFHFVIKYLYLQQWWHVFWNICMTLCLDWFDNSELYAAMKQHWMKKYVSCNIMNKSCLSHGSG